MTGKIYQTLPLYYGLESTGIYVHAANFDIPRKTADVTIESEVRNDSASAATVSLCVLIVGDDGRIRARINGGSAGVAPNAKTVLTATGSLKRARFWSSEDPYLYDVSAILKVEGNPVAVAKVVTGFRKTEFKGGVGTGGVYLNDKFVYLKGFAQRASDEWESLGQAYPDWMHDYNAKLIRDCHANYVRWMHISAQRVDADSLARFGIIQICPAGDKEREVTGRQWGQRVEVMRDSMIYYRNTPSILFWEAGNTIVTVDEIQQMVALRKRWDPYGGRLIGVRDNDDIAANTALAPYSEYYGIMIGQAPQTDQWSGPTAMFCGYSAERRDRAPLIETEDFR